MLPHVKTLILVSEWRQVDGQATQSQAETTTLSTLNCLATTTLKAETTTKTLDGLATTSLAESNHNSS